MYETTLDEAGINEEYMASLRDSAEHTGECDTRVLMVCLADSDDKGEKS
jgi:hypothetical protein